MCNEAVLGILRSVGVFFIAFFSILFIIQCSRLVARAISYGRFMLRRGLVIPKSDYFMFIRHCLKMSNKRIIIKWSDRSIWRGIGNWEVFDAKTGKMIRKGRDVDDENLYS